MSHRFEQLATVRTAVERPPAPQVDRLAGFDSATLHEAAGQVGALPSVIKPVHAGMACCGPAVTVQSPPRDNLWLHRAIAVAQPGDVLVVHVSDWHEAGYWGEIMSTAARRRGLAGLVIDGCVRDAVLLEEIGFPVFARGLCIRGTGKDFDARGWINHPVRIGDVTVHAGDVVRADRDGVVVIPAGRADAVAARAAERSAFEAGVIASIETGRSTLDLYGWDR